jgi:chemotaxis protein CheD
MYLASPEAIEIFLQPGDFYFGDEHTRIRTLLGSCVAITMWHPRLKQGGMCHYMLPEHTGRSRKRPDGRYADDVFVMFMRELAANRTHPSEYEVKVFGGGRMFLSQRKGKVIEALDIGLRNIEAGRRLLRENGFRVKAEHLAGDGHRNVIFDVASGHVWVRHVPELAISDSTKTRIQGGA